MKVDSGKFFYSKAAWTLRIVIIPKVCAISGRYIFLEPAWHGIAKWVTTSEIRPEVRWLSQEEYAAMLLKKNRKR